MSNKQFLLEQIGFERLKELASNWGYSVHDARLRAPGLAKLLARKRSVSIEGILEAMTAGVLERVAERLCLQKDGSAGELRGRLGAALASSTWKQLRRLSTGQPEAFEVLPAKLLEVVDGDTIRVALKGRETLVRLRGIDAPERSESDKAERELDRSGMELSAMVELGDRAASRLRELLQGRRIYLHCQLTPGGPKSYLHHNGYRLLAFVSIDHPDGPDIGEALLREGYALVWPRSLRTRRYLHPKSESYVKSCNQALQSKPGLWKSGMHNLCPPFKEPNLPWSLDHCKDHCFRHDWRDADVIEPAEET